MLEKVTERIYYMMNDINERPTLGIIKGDDYCLVYDAGNSPTHAGLFLQEIEKMNFPPIKYVLLSHHHWDHTFGLSKFNNITKIASIKTDELSNVYEGIKLDAKSLEVAKENKVLNDLAIELVKKEFGENSVLKELKYDLLFSGILEINLGGITCLIREIVNPHREDGTILYVPEEKTLFLGDAAYGCIKDGRSYYDSEKTISMMKEINYYEADHYLLSHESICTKEEMVSYFNDLNMGIDMNKGCTTIEEVIANFKNKYNEEPSRNDLFFLESFCESQ